MLTCQNCWAYKQVQHPDSMLFFERFSLVQCHWQTYPHRTFHGAEYSWLDSWRHTAYHHMDLWGWCDENIKSNSDWRLWTVDCYLKLLYRPDRPKSTFSKLHLLASTASNGQKSIRNFRWLETIANGTNIVIWVKITDKSQTLTQTATTKNAFHILRIESCHWCHTVPHRSHAVENFCLQETKFK